MQNFLNLTFISFLLPLFTLHYKVTPLVSNLVPAPKIDPHLKNPWGLFFAPNGDFWVADNGTNVSTIYQPDGTVIPFVINVSDAPTGARFNSSNFNYLIGSGSNVFPARFLFATETGKILGFNSSLDGSNAVVAVDNSASGNVYKGLELATSCCLQQPLLFATDFHNGKVDVYNSKFQVAGFIKDFNIPPGYAPFNIRVLDGNIYVTYAKQKPPENRDDDPGLGHGYIDVLSLNGFFLHRLVSNGKLNSPWGLALAPQNFGEFSGALLVGNFGDGKINAYNLNTGSFLGQLSDNTGTPIVIDGLWSLEFDITGKLYFSAGTHDEADGLVGTITPL